MSSEAAAIMVESAEKVTARMRDSQRSNVRTQVTSAASHSATMESEPPVANVRNVRSKAMALAAMVCASTCSTGVAPAPSSATRSTTRWPSSSGTPRCTHTANSRPDGAHAISFSCSDMRTRLEEQRVY